MSKVKEVVDHYAQAQMIGSSIGRLAHNIARELLEAVKGDLQDSPATNETADAVAIIQSLIKELE